MTELDVNSTKYLNTISMELSSHCNLKCIMCSHPTNKRQSYLMSFDNFKMIINKIQKTQINQLFLNMGEPFMNKLVFRMIAYAKRLNFQVYISTNGLLLNESYIKNILKTGVDALKFSIEGYSKEVYEKIRIGGSFNNLIKNVKLMKELRDRSGSKMSIRISTILMKDNEDIVKFVKFWGPYCDDIEYTGITDHIGLKNNNEITLNAKWKHRKTCPQIKPYNELNILSNGDMVICCVDFHGKCVLGNLLKQDLEEIWMSKRMVEIRKKAYSDRITELAPCNECYIADYSNIFQKEMRMAVSVIHEAVKNQIEDMLRQVEYFNGNGIQCESCSGFTKIAFAGLCFSCLQKKTGIN